LKIAKCKFGEANSFPGDFNLHSAFCNLQSPTPPSLLVSAFVPFSRYHLPMPAVNDAPDDGGRRESASPAHAIFSCVVMLGLIGLLVLAMVRLPRPQAGALPKEAAPNVPDQKLRFAGCDVRGHHLQNEPVMKAIDALHPAYLILQNVEEADAMALADRLKMHCAFHAETGADASAIAPVGECVLSKYPLSAAEAGAGIGMWTTSEVASQKFLIAAIWAPPDASPASTEQLLTEWWQRGSPPIVLAGRFPGKFADNEPVHLRSGWFDALSPWERLLPNSPVPEGSNQILLSPGWSCVAGGTITGYALAPSWIEASSSATATAPTTQAATQPADDD
jgi:hypothetical protein